MQRLGIAKQIEISDLLDKERFSVLAVTETFFSDENHMRGLVKTECLI